MRVPTTKTIIQATAVGIVAFVTFGVLNISSAEAPEPTTTIAAPATTLIPETTTTLAEVTTTAPEITVPAKSEEQLLLETKFSMGERSLSVVRLQTFLGLTPDGHYWTQTRAAHIYALVSRGMQTDNIPPEPAPAQRPEVKSKRPTASSPTTTTPVTTTPPPTTAPTPVVPPATKCPEYEATAISAGWAPNQLPKLMRIAYRESRCGPSAWNRRDPGTGSRGLTQINSFWCTPNQYNPTGFLQARGVLSTCEDLFNPYVSLRATYVIWQYAGWQPWGG